jgi:hypothetical protein
MKTRRTWERDWTAWVKEAVVKRELPCMGGCGDPATLVKYTGKRTGAFCRGCWGEIYWDRIPKLDRPKGLKRARRRR